MDGRERGRGAGTRVKGKKGSDKGREDRSGGEAYAAISDGFKRRSSGAEGRAVTRNRISQGVARDTRVTLEPTK